MKEHPILFSAPMVRALLDGSKTQTRRVVKFDDSLGRWDADGYSYVAPDTIVRVPWTARNIQQVIPCKFGQPGDRLWVREAFRFPGNLDNKSPSLIGEWSAKAGYQIGARPMEFEADGARVGNWAESIYVTPYAGKPRPSIHMPRWASRITLEVTGVRVERLQDISEADAQAEGCEIEYDTPDGHGSQPSYYRGYMNLWESINGPGSWDANPWVWVVEFKRGTP